MKTNSGLPAGPWRVIVQVIQPDGNVQADNVYSYNDETDAIEAAFNACEVAEQDAIDPTLEEGKS